MDERRMHEKKGNENENENMIVGLRIIIQFRQESPQ